LYGEFAGEFFADFDSVSYGFSSQYLVLLHLSAGVSTKTENALVSAVISGYYFVGLVC